VGGDEQGLRKGNTGHARKKKNLGVPVKPPADFNKKRGKRETPRGGKASRLVEKAIRREGTKTF